METVDTDTWISFGKKINQAESQYRKVTKLWELYVRLFGAKAFVLRMRGQPVSYAAVQFNKRSKGTWGKYINSYLVYTPPEFRKLGYATKLHREIEALAVSQGYQRTKSLIQTYVGFRFHLGLGHMFWGVNPNGELRCDSSLSQESMGVNLLGKISPPPGTQDVTNPHPLTVQEISQILQNPPYQQPKEQLTKLFATHRLGGLK